MRILMINKFYYLRGGSEACFFNTMSLLRDKGHKVIPFSMKHPDNEATEYMHYFVENNELRGEMSLLEKLQKGTKIIYSLEAQYKVRDLLMQEKFDIAHLHNIHHQLSPSIIVELKRHRIPIVMTLHDYKMVCPTYTLYDGENICEKCAGRRYTAALTSKCGQSFFERALLSLEMTIHHKIFDLYGLVDVFISPSQFLKDKLHQMGFKKEIRVLPNFVEMNSFPIDGKDDESQNNVVVYFGRLSREKGLFTLLEAARNVRGDIWIIGNGPLYEDLTNYASKNRLGNVTFWGWMDKQNLFNLVKKARVVVVPSEWYENNPMSVIEAFNLKKPVVASAIGGIPELVINDDTGFTFDVGNKKDLCDKLNQILENPAKAKEMGMRGYLLVKEKLNREVHYERLMEIYQYALDKNKQ